jgi:hypothetical protein
MSEMLSGRAAATAIAARVEAFVRQGALAKKIKREWATPHP